MLDHRRLSVEQVYMHKLKQEGRKSNIDEDCNLTESFLL